MDEKLKKRVEGAPRAFYINLGVNGYLARRCIDNKHLVIGHPEVSHETASLVYGEPQDKVRNAIRQEIQDCSGRNAHQAGRYPSHVMNFYTGGDYHPKGAGTGEDALWITFWNMRLWWTFAKGKAQPGQQLGQELYPGANHAGKKVAGVHGPRGQGWDYHWRAASGWLDKSLVTDEVLYLHKLGFILPRCKSTICEVGDENLEYLKSRVIGTGTGESEADLISHLDENQMEWFVEKLLCKMGWKRVSPVGGTQKDIDLVVAKDDTLAFVQVKAKTSDVVRRHVESLAEDFRATSSEGQKAEFYLVYHTPEEHFPSKEEVWSRETLAEMAVEHGLSDWLRKQVG